MAYHVERVSKIIERELSTILLTEAKNNLLKYVSITKVVVTNDLSIANIWFTVIGNQNEIQARLLLIISAEYYPASFLGLKMKIIYLKVLFAEYIR